MADDRRRLKSSLSMLSAGAERVRCLYRVPPAEARTGGGPATALLEALRSLPEQGDDEEQRQRARQAARGDTFEVCVRVYVCLRDASARVTKERLARLIVRRCEARCSGAGQLQTFTKNATYADL